jgi:lipopolysaccharide/colanic/teichoic acid biosynthesis glycosyltransferase
MDKNVYLPSLPHTYAARRHYQLPWWKRGLDILVSLSMLLALSPVLLLTALLIRLDSEGPIFYKAKRAGTNYRVFDMFKFRTMTVKADQLLGSLAANNIYAKLQPTAQSGVADGLCADCRLRGLSCGQPLFGRDAPICEKLYLRHGEQAATFMKFRNDPRITRLGGLLRNSSIDELPQLYNVLRGDMSLVGNRPLPLYEAEKLTADETIERFAGPAGLTGLWQIRKRAKGQGLMSDEERIQLDIEYARTFSFRLDMTILWQTAFSLWQQESV